MHNQLNNDQLKLFDVIINLAMNGKGRLIFVYAHGGMGKIFLWKIITAKLSSEIKIVLSVATSGITALRLPGGRTAHFEIPFAIDPKQMIHMRYQAWH